MRAPRWGIVLAVALASVGLGAIGPASGPARADGAGHTEPSGPAVARFPDGFPALVDSEWGFPIGGFGGPLDDDADYGVVADPAAVARVPVIFVHGNNVDHADWYPVRDAFIAAGWRPDDLWALSYNGLGNQAGSDGTGNPRRDDEHFATPGYDGVSRITSNDVNVPDLYAFILAVRQYTGSSRFSLVTHSLGVTVARKTLLAHPELRDDLVAFIGIAGGNHGTSLCPTGSEGVLNSCDEMAADSPWLTELNGPDGADETYGPTRWLTVSDGTGEYDVAYLGPDYADSPKLLGAENLELARFHNDLRIAPESIEIYRTWLEQVSVDRDAVREPPGTEATTTAEPPPVLPVTGGDRGLAPALVVAAIGSGLVSYRSRRARAT